MPGKRPILSVSRTFNSVNSVKIQLAVAVPALALLAAALAGPFDTAGQQRAASPAAYRTQVAPDPAISAAPVSVARQLTGSAQVDSIVMKDTGKHVALTSRQIARRMLRRFGWSRRQFRYLNLLWSHESGWNVHASNPYSGAYGIPQAVPGSKMAAAGRDWWSDARTQIRWGLRYIKQRYGSPRAAWRHEEATGWY